MVKLAIAVAPLLLLCSVPVNAQQCGFEERKERQESMIAKGLRKVPSILDGCAFGGIASGGGSGSGDSEHIRSVNMCDLGDIKDAFNEVKDGRNRSDDTENSVIDRAKGILDGLQSLHFEGLPMPSQSAGLPKSPLYDHIFNEDGE